MNLLYKTRDWGFRYTFSVNGIIALGAYLALTDKFAKGSVVCGIVTIRAISEITIVPSTMEVRIGAAGPRLATFDETDIPTGTAKLFASTTVNVEIPAGETIGLFAVGAPTTDGDIEVSGYYHVSSGK